VKWKSLEKLFQCDASICIAAALGPKAQISPLERIPYYDMNFNQIRHVFNETHEYYKKSKGMINRLYSKRVYLALINLDLFQHVYLHDEISQEHLPKIFKHFMSKRTNESKKQDITESVRDKNQLRTDRIREFGAKSKRKKYVYVLKLEHDKWYVGATDNVKSAVK